MMKKIYLHSVVFVATFLICSVSFAVYGMCGTAPDTGKVKSESKAVKVNNEICPVSGDKVNMKNPVMVEYNDKIYNLCCPACIEPFKSNPEKYISKMSKGDK